MKLLKKLLKLFIAFWIFLLSLPFLLYIPLVYNKNFYRDLIIENVYQFTDYKLSLDKLNLSVYPDLHLNLENISLSTKEKEISILQLKELNLDLFFIPVIAGGKLAVDDISLKKGFLDIPAFLNSIPKSNETSESEEKPNDYRNILELIHTKIRVKQILIEEVDLKIKEFHPSIYHNVWLNRATISYESFLDSKFSINVDYGKTNLYLKGSLGISPELLNLESLFFELECETSNIPLYEYSHYLKSFPNLSVSNSNVFFKILSQKKQNTLLIENSIDFRLNSISYWKEDTIHRIGPITIRGNIYYPLLSKKIETKNLTLNIPNLFDVTLNSEANFTYTPVIRANLHSSNVNINSILDFAKTFSSQTPVPNSGKTVSQKSENNLKLYLDLNYFVNRILIEGLPIYNLYANAKLKNTTLDYALGIRNFYSGKLSLSGEADLLNGVSTGAYLEIENVNMEKFTTTYLGKKIIEGNLSTYIKLQTDNQYGEKDFLKNLTLTGNTSLKDGILLDRADILYPIRFLNKIIPAQDKLNTNISRFNSIEMDFSAKNGRFKIKNLDLSGKIFNANGSVEIGLENPSEDIRANLVVSTSIAGAGLKIPMVYSKSSYVPFSIDKVWLASVYTGLVVGGPVGAMIGSALSEKADAALQSIKNKSKEQLNGN